MDLSDAGIESFWANTQPAMLAPLRQMNAAEHWTVDHTPEIQQHLSAIAAVLERSATELLSPAQQEALFHLLSFFRSSRALRIFAYLEQQTPGFSARVLREATAALGADCPSGGNDGAQSHHTAARVHVERLAFLARFDHLSRIFSRDRVAQLHAILEDVL